MLKAKVHQFLNVNIYFQKFIYLLIILNVLSIILASFKELYLPNEMLFESFEYFSVFIFSIEYILRLWTADLDSKNGSSISKRLKFSFSTYGLVDLFAILPFYLPFIFPFDLRFIRILRLFRLFRIFKLARLSKSLRTITAVLKASKNELAITFFSAFILIVLSSTLMFFAEHEAQPDKFENIGQSLWWSVETLTTVGYGDVYPITDLGKILSSVIALIGIGFVALPTAIISSAFISTMHNEKEKGKDCKCPKCGHEF